VDNLLKIYEKLSFGPFPFFSHSCFSFSCSKTADADSNNAAVDCSDGIKSFAADVNPIIQSTCATNSSCHAAGSSEGALTTYQQVYDRRSTIYAEVKSGRMSKKGSLSVLQRNAILCWIKNGAQNN
jgi:hypothetical protein